MLDWLVSIQLPNGAFQGGTVNAKPKVPVTFNTGQILFGLVSGSLEFGEPYAAAAMNAGDWLVNDQDSDGCWRDSPSPFTTPGEKTYETHVSWSLLQADRAFPNRGYAESALNNIHWAITKQAKNGWFSDCCLDDSTQPLTHTIGYALRGVLEGYIFSRDSDLLEAAERTATGLLHVIDDEGFIAGRLDCDWQGTVPWVCLTGSAQIAHSWLILHRLTGNDRYLSAGKKANLFVRRTMLTKDAPPETRGAVKGSFPVNGGYCPFWYLNWACKFVIDSLLEEIDGDRERLPSADGGTRDPHWDENLS